MKEKFNMEFPPDFITRTRFLLGNDCEKLSPNIGLFPQTNISFPKRWGGSPMIGAVPQTNISPPKLWGSSPNSGAAPQQFIFLPKLWD
jgi:hypothetical protein